MCPPRHPSPRSSPFEGMLAELLADPEFDRLLALAVREVVYVWHMEHSAARGMALSAIGEPIVLTAIYEAWSAWKQGLHSLHFVKAIVRKRIIKLLAQDARRPGHLSFEEASDEEPSAESFPHLLQRSPQLVLEHEEVIVRINRALDCFASQGKVQANRAELLRLRSLEGLSYRRLSRQLSTTENRLRNRVFKALQAFFDHVRRCHPELPALL